MNNYKQIYPDLDIFQNNLDTNARYKESYIMPGSPDYTPLPRINVHMVDLSNIGDTQETSQFQQNYQEEPRYEQQNENDSSGLYGEYKGPTGQSQDYYQKSNSDGGGGKSGGSFPKIVLAGIVVVVLVIVAFFLIRGKGGGALKAEESLIGEWVPFAFQQEEDVATFERDSIDSYNLIFNHDNTVKFLALGEEMYGTWSQDGKEIAVDLGERDSFNGKLEDGVFTMDVNYGLFHFNKKDSLISAREKEISDKSIYRGTFEDLFGTSENGKVEEIEVAKEEVSLEESSENSEELPKVPTVSQSTGTLDTKEDLIGDWSGVLVEMGHYGPAYENVETQQYDLIAEIGTNSGKYYFEAYLAEEPDLGPILSAYITMYDDYFTGDIGEEDAWILAHWLIPDQNGLLYAEYDDPTTLHVQYDYIETENSGFHLSFYFRKNGENWNDLPFKPQF